MTDETQVSEFLFRWLRGLDSEVAFWHTLFATGYPDHECLRPEARTGIPFRYPGLLAGLDADAAIQVLDVGAGPISCLGSIAPAPFRIEISACDPLAPAYNAILDKYGVSAPVHTAFAVGEFLTGFYPRNNFHIVHMANALDHAFDPLSVLRQMYAVCRAGGILLLSHNENEALTQKYEGLHQWNISAEGDQLFFWNRDQHVNVTEFLGGKAQVQCFRTEFPDRPTVVEARIRKLADLELQEAPAAAQYEPVFTVLCYLLSPDFRNVAKGLESCAEVRALALRLRLREVCRQLARWAKRMFLGHVRQCVVNSPAPQKGGPKCRLLK